MAWMTREAMLFFGSVHPHLFCFLAFGYATSPAASDDTDSQDMVNLLAPPSYVFCVWIFLVWSAYTSSRVFKLEPEHVPFLRPVIRFADSHFCLGLLIVILGSLGYVVVALSLGSMFLSGHWLYLTPIALISLWVMTMPYYLELEERCHWRIQNSIDSIQFAIDKLALRLWFVWLTAAVSFSVLDLLQFFHGDYFSFAVYAHTMGIFVAVSIAAYEQTRDPVVAWIATWFIVGLAMRKAMLEGDEKETFEKLQTVALTIAPMFAVVLFIDAVQGVYDFFANFALRSDTSLDAEGQSLNTVYGAV